MDINYFIFITVIIIFISLCWSGGLYLLTVQILDKIPNIRIWAVTGTVFSLIQLTMNHLLQFQLMLI